jgi:hypothetical protein
MGYDGVTIRIYIDMEALSLRRAGLSLWMGSGCVGEDGHDGCDK